MVLLTSFNSHVFSNFLTLDACELCKRCKSDGVDLMWMYNIREGNRSQFECLVKMSLLSRTKKNNNN